MSSPVSNVGALPPIPQIDYYFVSAGEINDFPADLTLPHQIVPI